MMESGENNNHNNQKNFSESNKKPISTRASETKNNNSESIDNIKISEKAIKAIEENKNENYKKFYKKDYFCDFRKKENSDLRIGIIKKINNNTLSIEDPHKKKEYDIEIGDSSKLSYFRKNTKPNNENFYESREGKKNLSEKLNNLEIKIKQGKLWEMNDPWEVYYFLHSKIYLTLDSAMKIDVTKSSYSSYYSIKNDENEGCQESFKIILCIIYFLSNYYKYIIEHKEEFVYYMNNIINTDLEDIKILDKKYAFFSFFDESRLLLEKIFGNEAEYNYWYKAFEDEILEFIPSAYLKKKEKKIDKIQSSKDLYPLYEEQINEKDKEKYEIVLKTICLENAYNKGTGYTSENVKLKAVIIAYIFDYFHALKGFSYLFQLIYCSENISVELMKKMVDNLSFGNVMTDNYANICEDEKNIIP